MVSDPLLMRAGRLVLGGCLFAAAYTPVGRAAEMPARIALLAAGQRASVVIEFDGDAPKATAIEAPDSRSFAVEIGPVHSTIANQLLQAAKQSPLVSEVRVRTAPQGAQGTLITLHVTAKTAVSGLVRRAQRRIYIDLEPLPAASAALQGRAEAAPDAAGFGGAAAEARGANPLPAIIRPSTAAANNPQGLPGAGTAAQLSPAQPIAASPTAASPSSPAAALPADQIRRRAESLARQMDVKGLEKLKADLIARRSPSSGTSSTSEEVDRMIAQIDDYLDEARKDRLLTDARMFKGSASSDRSAAAASSTASPAPASPNEAFRNAIVPLVSELQTMNAMLSQWQPGFVPSPNLPQLLQALTIRLRALSPPAALNVSHERLCVALGALAKSWVPGPDGISLIPVGNDARLIVTAKAAIYDYLQGIAQQESTDATRSATELS